MIAIASTSSAVLPAWLTAILGLSGWAASAAGIAWGLAQVAARVRSILVDDLYRQALLIRRLADYRAVRGTPADIPRAVALLNEVFGPDHVTEDFVAAKLQGCPDALTIITRNDEPKAAPAGCFLVYGLRASACKGIADGSIINGYKLGQDELVSLADSPSALYIGIVGGRSIGFDRAATLFALRDVLRDRLRACGTIGAIFARPNTDHGSRLAVELGFEPVRQPRSQIWSVPRTRIERLVAG